VHLLQVCNVGEICGGTAACAWSVTRSFPQWQHTVAFLNPVRHATRRAFAPHLVLEWPRVTAALVEAVEADGLLLHNTSPHRLPEPVGVPTWQYAHSRTPLAAADATLYCSQWLADEWGAASADVCWQGVPIPPWPAVIGADRPCLPERPAVQDGSATVRVIDREFLVVGRLCTPTPRKWPTDVLPFYAALTARCPFVWWEFVGCPRVLESALRTACAGRATFWSAGWERRDRYFTWDALLYHHPRLTESFGRTVAEAMCAGCVPIVDGRGGFREQLDRGGGFLCGTFSDFVTALDTLRDTATRQAIAHRAIEVARERFSLEAFARRLTGWLT